MGPIKLPGASPPAPEGGSATPSAPGLPHGAPHAPPGIPGLHGPPGPPLRVPGSHFAAGVLFLVAGGVGLVAVAPALAAGAFLSPGVAATTHLFTLGWLTLSIMGVLYQLVPVALGTPVRWRGLALPTLAVFGVGVAAFVAGVSGGSIGFGAPGSGVAAAGGVPAARLLSWGAGAVALAVLVFLANLAATLARVPRRDVTWWALVVGGVSLFFTLGLGLILALNLQRPLLGSGRLAVVAIHLHIAAAGWILAVMAGVAQKLLPMFLLSQGVDERPGRWAVGLLAGGVALLALLHHGIPLTARWLPAGLLFAGAAAFLLQALLFFRHRRRPDLDPGLSAAAGSLVTLTLALVLAPATLVAGMDAPRLLVGYGVLLVLGLSLFVAAHYLKIVPFLVLVRRHAPGAAPGAMPRVEDLFSATLARWAGRLLLAGTLLLAGSVLVGSATGARAGAVAFLAGAVIQAVQIVSLLVGRGPRPRGWAGS